jgi:tetratricopeptide (TPR) repeat protein
MSAVPAAASETPDALMERVESLPDAVLRDVIAAMSDDVLRDFGAGLSETTLREVIGVVPDETLRDVARNLARGKRSRRLVEFAISVPNKVLRNLALTLPDYLLRKVPKRLPDVVLRDVVKEIPEATLRMLARGLPAPTLEELLQVATGVSTAPEWGSDSGALLGFAAPAEEAADEVPYGEGDIPEWRRDLDYLLSGQRQISELRKAIAMGVADDEARNRKRQELGLLLLTYGKLEEAEATFQQLLRDLEADESWGRGSGEASRELLAAVEQSLSALLQRDPARADDLEDLRYRSLRASEAKLGPFHPFTLSATRRLAKMLSMQGKGERAAALYELLAQRCEKLLLAGDLQDADTVVKRLQRDIAAVLGTKHPLATTVDGLKTARPERQKRRLRFSKKRKE